MENTNNCRFLIEKLEAGETFNDLDELISCEAFTDEQAEQIDEIMKWLDLDDATTSAIGDLLLAVTSRQEIAKSCDAANWPSITGIELAELPCLIHKSELNQVEEFIQRLVTKAEMDENETDIISKSLETIADLDEISLGAVYDLLRLEFSKDTITRKWPSLFSHVSSDIEDSEPVKKSGLRWPSISVR